MFTCSVLDLSFANLSDKVHFIQYFKVIMNSIAEIELPKFFK